MWYPVHIIREYQKFVRAAKASASSSACELRSPQLALLVTGVLANNLQAYAMALYLRLAVVAAFLGLALGAVQPKCTAAACITCAANTATKCAVCSQRHALLESGACSSQCAKVRVNAGRTPWERRQAH